MGAVVTNNNKERDATTWLGTIVWISLGPRKQLLGSKWHKSECTTSTLVNFYHYNTTNIRRPHKCKRATNTSLVDTSTREPLWDNMTTRVVSHLLGVNSQLTTPGNNIWDSTGPWSKPDHLIPQMLWICLWFFKLSITLSKNKATISPNKNGKGQKLAMLKSQARRKQEKTVRKLDLWMFFLGQLHVLGGNKRKRCLLSYNFVCKAGQTNLR